VASADPARLRDLLAGPGVTVTGTPGAEELTVAGVTARHVGEYAYSALRAGASGFLLKDALPDELLAGIRAVAAGDAVVAPAMTRRLLDTYTRQLGPSPGKAVDTDRLTDLSAREREVLLDMARGLTNSEIADHLVLSESTIKTHVSRVLAKTGARDRVHAVIIACDAGLVRPGGPA
jgi:DNA-binding NarL/FixJ family response regulator